MEKLQREHTSYSLMKAAGGIFVFLLFTIGALVAITTISNLFESITSNAPDAFNKQFNSIKIFPKMKSIVIVLIAIEASVSYVLQVIGTIIYGTQKEKNSAVLTASIVACFIPIVGLFVRRVAMVNRANDMKSKRNGQIPNNQEDDILRG